jgi:hypothetical protein
MTVDMIVAMGMSSFARRNSRCWRRVRGAIGDFWSKAPARFLFVPGSLRHSLHSPEPGRCAQLARRRAERTSPISPSAIAR